MFWVGKRKTTPHSSSGGWGALAWVTGPLRPQAELPICKTRSPALMAPPTEPVTPNWLEVLPVPNWKALPDVTSG
jgi:hypothetical protein